jgi:hypothetical protein
MLELPTVGVTDEPLVATGDEPEARWGAQAPPKLAHGCLL